MYGIKVIFLVAEQGKIVSAFTMFINDIINIQKNTNIIIGKPLHPIFLTWQWKVWMLEVFKSKYLSPRINYLIAISAICMMKSSLKSFDEQAGKYPSFKIIIIASFLFCGFICRWLRRKGNPSNQKFCGKKVGILEKLLLYMRTLK